MPTTKKTTWVVKPFGADEPVEITGTRLVTDDANTNRVTIYDGDDVVAQMNSVESVYPK